MAFRTAARTRAVLRVLLDEPREAHYGLEISKAAGLAYGSVYPILARLERDGWLESDWEKIDEQAVGRRRRRCYSLTSDGLTWGRRMPVISFDRLSRPPARPLIPEWAIER